MRSHRLGNGKSEACNFIIHVQTKSVGKAHGYMQTNIIYVQERKSTDPHSPISNLAFQVWFLKLFNTFLNFAIKTSKKISVGWKNLRMYNDLKKIMTIFPPSLSTFYVGYTSWAYPYSDTFLPRVDNNKTWIWSKFQSYMNFNFSKNWSLCVWGTRRKKVTKSIFSYGVLFITFIIF